MSNNWSVLHENLGSRMTLTSWGTTEGARATLDFALGRSEILRVGFTANVSTVEGIFELNYLDQDGQLIESSAPDVHSSLTAEGLMSVLLEIKGRRNAVRVELVSSNASLNPEGPIHFERFSNAAGGPYLGAESVFDVPGEGAELRIEARLVGGNGSKPALIAVRFWDGSGRELLPPSEGSVNPIIGGYASLRKKGDVEDSASTLPVPEGTRRLALRQLYNRNEAVMVAELRVKLASSKQHDVQEFLEANRNRTGVVVIDSTAPPLGSGVVTIRPNNLAIKYAELGYAVISIGYGKLNGAVRSPMDGIIQVNRDELWDTISVLKTLGNDVQKLYVCSSFPSPNAVVALDELSAVGWKTLYEIRDDMEEFNRVGLSQWYSAEAETVLCRRADKITAVSPALSMKARVLNAGKNHPVTIPNAIHQHFIDNARPLRNLNVVEEKRKGRIVGYVGHLTPAWFDWETFLEAAEELLDLKFELIGPGKPAEIKLPENVTYLGPRRQTELQSLTEHWATGVIPFKKSPLTRGVDPNKLFEYCAWGLRTVSAEMGSIDECPVAFSYKTIDEFVSGLQYTLETPWTQGELDRLESFLEKSTWLDRAQRTLEVVGI